MAVTRKSYSIVMTAAGDTWAAPIRARQIRFVGTGLTAGQRLLIKEIDTNGAIISDHYVQQTNEDFVLWEGSHARGGGVYKPFIDLMPLAGTPSVIFQLA